MIFPSKRSMSGLSLFLSLVILLATDGFILTRQVSFLEHRSLAGAKAASTRGNVAHHTMGVQVKTITQAANGAVKPKIGDIVVCHYTGMRCNCARSPGVVETSVPVRRLFTHNVRDKGQTIWCAQQAALSYSLSYSLLRPQPFSRALSSSLAR